MICTYPMFDTCRRIVDSHNIPDGREFFFIDRTTGKQDHIRYKRIGKNICSKNSRGVWNSIVNDFSGFYPKWSHSYSKAILV